MIGSNHAVQPDARPGEREIGLAAGGSRHVHAKADRTFVLPPRPVATEDPGIAGIVVDLDVGGQLPRLSGIGTLHHAFERAAEQARIGGEVRRDLEVEAGIDRAAERRAPRPCRAGIPRNEHPTREGRHEHRPVGGEPRRQSQARRAVSLERTFVGNPTVTAVHRAHQPAFARDQIHLTRRFEAGWTDYAEDFAGMCDLAPTPTAIVGAPHAMAAEEGRLVLRPVGRNRESPDPVHGNLVAAPCFAPVFGEVEARRRDGEHAAIRGELLREQNLSRLIGAGFERGRLRRQLDLLP